MARRVDVPVAARGMGVGVKLDYILYEIQISSHSLVDPVEMDFYILLRDLEPEENVIVYSLGARVEQNKMDDQQLCSLVYLTPTAGLRNRLRLTGSTMGKKILSSCSASGAAHPPGEETMLFLSPHIVRWDPRNSRSRSRRLCSLAVISDAASVEMGFSNRGVSIGNVCGGQRPDGLTMANCQVWVKRRTDESLV